jgi:hypothetical protein
MHSQIVNADGALGAGRILYSLSLFLRRSQKQTVKLIARLMSLSVRSPDADEEAHKFCCSRRERVWADFCSPSSICCVCVVAISLWWPPFVCQMFATERKKETHQIISQNSQFTERKDTRTRSCMMIMGLSQEIRPKLGVLLLDQDFRFNHAKEKKVKNTIFFLTVYNYESYIYLFNEVQKNLTLF